MTEYRMPSLGADMEAGTLLEWKIKPGDHVHRGDIGAVVETDKGAIEIEVFQDGIVDRLLIEPHTRVPVGTPIASFRAEGEAPGAAAPATPAPAAAEAKPAPPSPPTQAPPGAQAEAQVPKRAAATPRATPTSGGPRAVPAAQKRAQELGLDLTSIRGTGEGGAITKADVERAAAAKPADRGAAMRRAIAAAMARANREIPHYYLSDTIDMEAALARLEAFNTSLPLRERVLSGVVQLRAVALTAREYPEFNGFWQEGGFTAAACVHLGVAIALKSGGLVTPAIHDADRKSLAAIMAALRDLITRARGGAGSLRSSEVSEATLTVTNLGDLGVESVYGVIYPPQVALVGFGTIQARPWVTNGKVEPRRLCQITLAADHRASDGLRGAQFLAAIKRRLQTDLDEVFA
jgi:pyruvate dehydrogenase E2 component (dihydrolipoamide acetyltransferase)